jgi:hypothetical protein
VAIPPVAAAAPAQATSASGAPRRSFAAVLERRSASAAGLEQAGSGSPLRAVEWVEQARLRLDAVLEAARHGRTFTAQELLGLQAQAYRYAQTVDLASKLVESGAQSVKQALASQT